MALERDVDADVCRPGAAMNWGSAVANNVTTHDYDSARQAGIKPKRCYPHPEGM
jgi:hypothetical protein